MGRKYSPFIVMFSLAAFFILSRQTFAEPTAAPLPQACDSPANEIVAENCLSGNPPSEWDISGAGDASIQGFATQISVDQGETIAFKVDTDATAYHIDIYRIGYYNGSGARKWATVLPSAALPQSQPACLNEPTTGLIDCGNWAVSAAWTVPSDAVSGVYIAKLVREDTGGASHMIFVVRDDDGASDLLFQTSDTTWQAYNQYGGNSLYVGSPAGRAYKVSYNRPFTTRGSSAEDWFFNAEYPMIRWLEANGYDVSYFTGVDTDRFGAELLEHRVFMSVGHDEYWSKAQRTNVEAARDAGINLAFFSSNEIFWKTRWEASIDGSNTPYRTLVTYKETHAGAKIDPEADIWTGTWRDPRPFNPEGPQPENALTGQIFMVNCCTYAITVPAADGRMRFWRNTDIATLTPEQVATLPDGTLGYEWDEALDNGYSPPGLILLSTTTVNVPQYIQDYGSTYEPATATHNAVMYRDDSGALVFGSGTLQWSWGLDSNHDRGNAPPDSRMQQATVNLLADMGVQPATLQVGLVPAAPSTDTQSPASVITSPTSGETVQVGNTVTITGTASDSGGGVVGGVEVSVDGGATWRRASGRETWSYQWIPQATGSTTLLSRAVDDSGNLETPSTSVTVNIEPRTCPCTIWDNLLPGTALENDPQAVELGVKFQSELDGYITGIRFYKGPQNTGTHVGRLWRGDGTLLAEETFIGETPSGWQEVQFASPVAITANTTYVASYHAPNGFYAEDENYFATSDYRSSPLRALANGEDGPNGVYRYGAGGIFPTETYVASNYWVDVIFVEDVGPDTTPPTVLSTVPANTASDVSAQADIKATFSEAIDPSTITSSTFELRDALNTPVPASVTYTQSNRTAVLNPSMTLDYSAAYTATIKGGSAGVKDFAGNELAADYTWSFTTTAPPPPPPDEGPGGPILVIAHSGNVFGRYFAEILRTEGLNAFTVTDISLVSAASLADYDVVILGEMPLTAAQVTLLTDWVNDGGNLIAMRPDKQLAGLLGLTDAGGVLSDGYLLINSPGIVNQVIQFHGTADRYTLNGATALAMLYSNAITPTAHPAVTLRSVGSNGGQAAAFTFDLARSVVYTRQGNPAWAGQERDGVSPIRPNDMFYGGSASDPQPDWIDLSKVAIPQADEQQRLLANLILAMNLDQMPLPRFWYFPHGEKAVIVLTGDDHGSGGTIGQFDNLKAASPAGCSVDDWECLRSTSYIYTYTPLSDMLALVYQNEGFEIAAHFNTGCADWTPASLQSVFAADWGAWKAKYISLNDPITNRTHCIAWSDWATHAKVEYEFGIRLDTNYYYWPPSWVQNSPGMFTGSGMPMRFADLDGSLIDVYQAVTQMTDESGQTYPFTADQLLDRALGPEGYYGAFTANMHTDQSNHAGANAIVASALARSVPVVSARQMLTWLDGRNASSFGSLEWDGNTLTFVINVGTGANGLQAMLPTASANGDLTGITLSGNPVTYVTETIKGVEYARFNAIGGSYTAQYALDTVAPVISDVNAVVNLDNTVMVTWTTNEAASSQVDYGADAGTLDQTTSDPVLVTAHAVTLTGLAPNTTYYYTVTSTDAANNSATSAVYSFTTFALLVVDTTVADFSAGAPDANTAISLLEDGEVMLKPAINEEFSGTALPAGWSVLSVWNPGGSGSVGAGKLTVDEVLVGTNDFYGPGRSLEFIATFGTTRLQHVGFGVDFNSAPWAIFSTGLNGGVLLARTNVNGSMVDTPILSSGFNVPHLYRIEWNASSVNFYVDGQLVATHNVSISGNMRPLVSELNGAEPLVVDWLRMSPYASPAVFESRIFDAGAPANWNTLQWISDAPPGTSLALSYRTGDSPTPDGTWSAYTPVAASGTYLAVNSRYIQYRAQLATTDSMQTPLLKQVAITYTTGEDTTPPTVVARSPVPNAEEVALDANVTVQFSEPMDAATLSTVTFRLRADGAAEDVAAAVTYDDASRTATLNPNSDLSPATAYSVTVSGSVADASGNPLGSDDVWSFTTVLPSLVDTTLVDFGAGTPDVNTYIAATEDGEVMLNPTVGSEFSGTMLPSGWTTGWNGQPWTTGGSVTVSGGSLSVNGSVAYSPSASAGHVLEFEATFNADQFQHVGFASDLSTVASEWAMFSTFNTTNTLYARVNNQGATTDVALAGTWLGAPHRYRIVWTAVSVTFFIDDNQVYQQSIALGNMKAAVSDYHTNATAVTVNWLRMTPYAASGTFISRVFDAGNPAEWDRLYWISDVPDGTSLVLSYRTGDGPIPDGTWSAFTTVTTSGGAVAVTSRYIQYRAEFVTSNPDLTPALKQVAITYALTPDTTPPTIVARSPAPNAEEVALDANVTVQFSEPMDAATLSTVTFRLRADGAAEDVAAAVTYDDASRTATLNPNSDLSPATVYSVTVSGSVADASGNPLGSDDVWSFTTALLQLVDTTVNDFNAGTTGACAVIADVGDGAVSLPPILNEQFSGTVLSTGWSVHQWPSAGTATVSNGQIIVDGAMAYEGVYSAGHVLEFAATFGATNYQAVGFAKGADDNLGGQFALIGTLGTTDRLFVFTSDGSFTQVSGAVVGVPQRFRIEWDANEVRFYFNDTFLLARTIALTGPLFPFASDYNNGGASLSVDWMRMTPYQDTCTFTSRVFDGGAVVRWKDMSWVASLPAGTGMMLSYRTGNSPTPDGTWSAFAPLANAGDPIGAIARYLQYKADLTTADIHKTSVLEHVVLRIGMAGTPPVVAPISNVTLYEGETVNVSIAAADAELDPLTLSLEIVGDNTGLVPTLDYTFTDNGDGTGSLNWFTQDGDADTYTATVTASDGIYSGTGSFTITLNALADLSLTVTLQERTNHSGNYTITLYQPNTNIQVAAFIGSANSAGQFTLTGITPGDYDVYLKHDQFLAAKQSLSLVSGNNQADFGELRGGDADNNSRVELLDFSALAARFNTAAGDLGYNAAVDFNHDGYVTILDFSILASNFNQSGDEPQ